MRARTCGGALPIRLAACGPPPVSRQQKARSLRAGLSNVSKIPCVSGDRADPRAHQADAVEVGLLARVLFSALTGLVALVEQFDLL